MELFQVSVPPQIPVPLLDPDLCFFPEFSFEIQGI